MTPFLPAKSQKTRQDEKKVKSRQDADKPHARQGTDENKTNSNNDNSNGNGNGKDVRQGVRMPSFECNYIYVSLNLFRVSSPHSITDESTGRYAVAKQKHEGNERNVRADWKHIQRHTYRRTFVFAVCRASFSLGTE